MDQKLIYKSHSSILAYSSNCVGKIIAHSKEGEMGISKEASVVVILVILFIACFIKGVKKLGCFEKVFVFVTIAIILIAIIYIKTKGG